MIQFSKLRLYGFKSFVDKTELEIAPGLNGIVGPNGCGKSNLVEALRWVMGESSAKRMRGDGMEDVIFSGSSKRSARNIAEVSLLLDNTTRTAPAEYNANEEIEVVRRIERDRGSNYKVNGKNVRARDVQMLFADTVTGANSPAIVSQGRVAQIINAKPLDRRIILEESAGISGLYARRHEAELRLKAADRNLIRVEDILGGMEGRLSALKRQARQASRYRNIAAQIRQLEILIAHTEWNTIEERKESARKKFEEAESTVAQKMTTVTQLTKTQSVQMQDIPPLRQKEAEISAALQTQKIAMQRIEDEAARREEILQETQEQINQTAHDSEHEKQSLGESSTRLEQLEEEHKKLLEKEKNDDGSLEEKQKARDALEEKVVQLEEKYTALMQGEAESKARRQSLAQQIEQNQQRIETITARKQVAQAELNELKKDNKDQSAIEALSKEIAALEGNAAKIAAALEKAEDGEETARAKVSETRDDLKTSENKLSEISAEIAILESFLAEEQDGGFSPVLDSVTPETGFEKALSRALGDALLASLDDGAPVKWIARKKPADMPTLPKGAQAMLPVVKAPKELHLALSQIGYVDSEADGDALSEGLLPGQALVSRAGTYWRWDGYYIQADASDRNAQHLEQKNKLKELEAKRPSIEKAVLSAEDALEKASNTLNELKDTQKELQTKRRENDQSLTDKRAALSELREKNARYDSEIRRLSDILNTSDEDIQTLSEVIKWDTDRLKTYEQQAEENKNEGLDDIKAALSEARESYQAATRAFDLYQQEQNTRKARLHAIADERVNLQNRTIRSRERMKQLDERKISLDEKLKELKAQPQDFKNDQEQLLDKISKLEQERSNAADLLAKAENEVTETSRALKEAESKLSEARETRAGLQATLSALQEQRDTLSASIQEQFEMPPEQLKNHSAIDISKEQDSLENLKGKKEKLLRERDNIGPVNLRADDEAQELEKEVGGLLHERNDLISAIEELRGAINTINKEARERLVTAFEHVNAHFQRLFAQLFAGGKAYLSLIDSDDPLGAGLEIYAQPPGKALQSLSLLSGGEQALTSIALIFGMFLTNPSPICVLDEIDAPLDDANVDRLCNLLDQIAARGETRFLIVTHHRLTMARMDRLYGVTMAEKGISQLVSVDLQESFDFLEEAA
ncbi:MAG: chromosome segregation protein SMC [Alphaproteobacteria bacterium]|nr:chromosome segregation protein SMC [Alphaproteobacteria bacterium]